MKIGIDLDEVLAEFVKGYLKLFENNYERKADYNKLFSYNLWESLGITKEEAIELVDEFYDSDGFENIGVVEGAKDCVAKLFEDNELFVITSRPVEIRDKTVDFLQKHFQDIDFKLIHSNDFFKGEGKSKSEFCRDLGVSVLIEDNKEYAIDCAKNGVRVLMLDKPWNQNHEGHENIIRVKNWEDILDKIENA